MTKRDWQRGRHSNLPRCCVAYFVVRTRFMPRRVKLLLRDLRERRDLRNMPPFEHMYVRCPVCVVRRRHADQHMCNVECRGQAGAAARIYD